MPPLPPGDGLDIVRHTVFDCIEICQDDLAAGLKYVPSARKCYQPPAQLSDMYQELRRKVGVAEARRLIKDHMRLRGISYEDVGRGSSVGGEPIGLEDGRIAHG